MSLGHDPEVPAGFQDADIEQRELEAEARAEHLAEGLAVERHQEAKHAEREGDRALWKPEGGNLMASGPANERVRRMLLGELAARVGDRDPDESLDEAWGHVRGDFARDWVALAAKLGIKGPGDEQRTPTDDKPSMTREGKKLSAANTRLRQFLEGHRELDWVLVGIESVICDRHGMALPGGAYQVQQRLEVGEDG